jgi:hypothetical protein
VKIGKCASETLHLLTAYGEYSMKKLSVLNGTGGSRKGEKMCKTIQEVGSQKTQRTGGNVDRVRTLLRSDRRVGVRVIAEVLNMNSETVRQIVKKDLEMRKISAKMVPRILTDGQKQRRLHISSELLRNVETFDRVITGDVPCCFQYDPEAKRQTMKWKTQNSPRPIKSTHVSVACQDHACFFNMIY